MPARGRQRGGSRTPSLPTSALGRPPAVPLPSSSAARGEAARRSRSRVSRRSQILKRDESSRKVTVSLYSQGNYQEKDLGSATFAYRRYNTSQRQISVAVRLDFSSQPRLSRGEKEWELPSGWLPDPSVCLTLARSGG